MPPAKPKPTRTDNLRRLVHKARAEAKPAKSYNYEIKRPVLMPGVVPKGEAAPVMAMDGPCASSYDYARSMVGYGADWVGFPGYPYLAQLSTRAEYRMFAQAIGTALTREWIVLNSTETAGDSTKEKITALTDAIKEIGLRGVIKMCAEHDSFYGRAQIFLDLKWSKNRELPFTLSEKTTPRLKKGESVGKYFGIKAIEAIWTTPKAYNAIDPTEPDFYVPSSWFVMGREIHSTRLLTIVARPVSDMLKPAFNFGGMSMSQLAEAYVDNWLRTRQSVSDLINNFSIVALKTKMEQALTAGDDQDGEDLFKRAELFTLMRSNQGLMLMDFDTEDLVMLNTPIGGLSELQAQAQEQMCSVSHTPSVELLGIAPSGFGNVAEGEIRTWNDWVTAIFESDYRKPVETVIDILQLIMYGEIDKDLVVTFEPLYQMTPKELAEIRTADGQTDSAYIAAGVIDPTEVREKLARNPESGYQGIDVGKVPGLSEDPNETAQENENEDVP